MIKRHKKTVLLGLILLINITALSVSATSPRGTFWMYGMAANSFLNIRENVVREHSPITLEVHNIYIGAVYKVNWTSDNYGIRFIGSEKTFESFTIGVHAPFNNSFVTFNLVMNSTGEILDSLVRRFIHSDERNIVDLITNLPPIFIFGITVFIITVVPLSVLYKKKK